MTRYSQNDEQDVILRFFNGRKGTFLDIGAFDGVTFSNTRALLELGWSGTMIEPDPRNVVKLMDNLRPFASQVEVIAAAVALETYPMELRMDETADRGWASTVVAANQGVLRQSPMRLRVPTIHPCSLLSPTPLFISLDAEHMDFAILRELPNDIGGCEMISIEPCNLAEREQMKDYLYHRGFKAIHETPENIIAVKSL